MIDASTISFAPMLPVPLLSGLLGIAILASLYALIRRARGAMLRLGTALALGLILLNPALVTEQREPLRDVALMVVDRSPSQQIGTRTAQANTAAEAIAKKIEALPNIDLRRIDSPAGGDETKLFAEIDRALADVPEKRRAGVVLITDGQIHDVPEKPAHYGPVQALLTGSPDEVDRRLRIVSAPGYGMVGQQAEARLIVEDMPRAQSDTASLTLHRDDGSTETLRVPVGKEFTLPLPISHAGTNLTALEVEKAPNELTASNNSAALLVNGVRDRLRVLLISGMPHNGERTWRNLLKSDPSIDLVHFTILRQPSKMSMVPDRELSLIPFPVHELFVVKLRQFDLVVFDRYTEPNLLAANYLLSIKNYVEHGGALLDATGPDIVSPSSLNRTMLAPIMPSQPAGALINQAFRPQVSATGLRHPVTAALPGVKPDGSADWGNWLRLSPIVPAADASVLMTGAEQSPLLVLNKAGDGRVAQLTSDQIWLWARGYEGGGPQVELLRPLVHWLMKEPELEAERLTAAVDGDRINLQRTSQNPSNDPVTATLPDGSNVSVTMKDDGRHASGSLSAVMPGIYRFSDGTSSTLTIVGRPNAPELQDQRATPDRLQPLQDQTGGGHFWLAEDATGPEVRSISPGAAAAGRGWLGLASNNDYTVTGFSSRSLLPPLLALLSALLPLLWGWRREGR